MDVQRSAAWLLEAFAISAVNLYMLLSGYFLSRTSFKLTRLLQLLLQVWTYSVGIGILSILMGWCPADQVNVHLFLTLLFPVAQEHYWFITAYVFLYLLLPFIGNAVLKMDKKAFQVMLVLLLIVLCAMKSFLPFRFETDRKGYDCLWYFAMFLTAAYVRRFGISFLQKKVWGILLYVIASLAVFGGSMVLRGIYLRTGRLELIVPACYEYNHILPFVASVGLFTAFLGWHAKENAFYRFVAQIGRYTLGVYLLHENLTVRYLWPQWLGAERADGVAGLLLCWIVAVLIVFCIGILVEFLRTKLMQGLHGILCRVRPYGAFVDWLIKVDSAWKTDGNEMEQQ